MTIEAKIVSLLNNEISDGASNVPLYHRVIPQSHADHRALVYNMTGSSPIVAKGSTIMGTNYEVDITIAHRESDKLQTVAAAVRNALEGYQNLSAADRWNYTLYQGEEGHVDERLPDYHIIIQTYQFTKANY